MSITIIDLFFGCYTTFTHEVHKYQSISGLYVPLGMLSVSVSNVIKLLPLAQVATLLRQIMMDNVIHTILKDVPANQLSDFKTQYGIELVIGSHLLTPFEIISMLASFGILFYIGSIIIIKRIKK